MIDRRIRAAIRKYKLTGLALFSLLGLTSIFSVNIAGFLVLLPKPLWGLLNAAFVTGYFLRFSIFLALAVLVSRYSFYFTSHILGYLYAPTLIIWLLAKKSGRRLIRLQGYKGVIDVVVALMRLHKKQVNEGINNENLKFAARRIFKSRLTRKWMGVFLVAAAAQGTAYGRVEHLKIPIQFVAFGAVLSILFTTLSGSIVLVSLAAFLFFIIPPTPLGVYLSKPYLENNLSFFTMLRFSSLKMLSIQKITLMSLTASFASGVFHHNSLISESGFLKFSGEVDLSGAMVLATPSGFIIYTSKEKYKFLPIEGTQIEVLPLTSE